MQQAFFRDMIGHEKIQEVLERAIAHKQLAHAYLLVGPEGVGKTALARALLQQIFAGANIDVHPDIQWVARIVDEKTGKQKSAISVDQIRELKQRMDMSAMGGGYKAAFIEDAGALNSASANALLKTLEEPSGNTVLLLRANHVESVPATIASRCQIIRFSLIGRDVIANALEKRGLVQKDAERLAALALGRPGHAIRLYQDSQFSAERETALGSLLDLLGKPLAERLGAIAGILPKEEANKSDEAERNLGMWEIVLRDILLHAIGRGELGVVTNERERVASFARRIPTDDLLDALDRLRDSRESLSSNVNPQLALEHVLLRL